MDDMTWHCVDIASLKILYEKPKGKNSYKEKSAVWCFQQVINQRDERLSPETCKLFIPMYSTHMKCEV